MSRSDDPDRAHERRMRAMDEQRERELRHERLAEVTPPPPRLATLPRPITSAMVALAWTVAYGPVAEREDAARVLAELVLEG